jgi:5-methylthioribose kinase
MNCVLRIETARSFIIKQSRGYVEKYPQIAAPAERVLTEGATKKIARSKECSMSCRAQVLMRLIT